MGVNKIAVMKICWLVIGKTDAAYIREGIAEYEKRLVKYVPYEMKVLPDVKYVKNRTEVQQTEREGELLLGQFQESDWVVLLDERGKQYSSVEFAAYLELRMVSGLKRLVFVVGGPFGFSEGVDARANVWVSLSWMTFVHELVRMLFVDKFYRAMTIL